MKKTKILQIMEDLDMGGTEKSLCRWLKYFNRDKFDINVISLRDGILKKEIEDVGISLEILTKSKTWDIGFLFKLIRKIKAINPDIVHCRNGMRAIMYGGIAAKLCRKPLITSIHGRTHYLKLNFRTKIWLWVIRLSDMVITVSESIKEEMFKLAKIDKNKIKVIYNGIEIGEVKIGKNRREEFGLSKDDFVIGTVGSLRKIKGHKYLIEAMSLILKNIPNAKLVLIGEGEEELNLKRLSFDLNLNGRIKFLGYREDAKELMEIFDIFVLPSISEGFPNVLLEAVVNRKPIVATRVGGVEEIIKDRYSALLVEKENAEKIAHRIIELKDNPRLIDELVSNAFQAVSGNFGLDKFIKGYEKAYAGIFNGSRI